MVAPEHQWPLGPGEERRPQWRAEGLIINWSLSAEWRAGLEAGRPGGGGRNSVQVQQDGGLLLRGGIGDQK